MNNYNIGDDLIKLLLDKIFEKCGYSLFEMEKFIKKFIFGEKFDVCNKCEKLYDLEKELINLEDMLGLEKSDVKYLEKELKKQEVHHFNERNKLKEYIKRLKENSIVFSMDDIGEL